MNSYPTSSAYTTAALDPSIKIVTPREATMAMVRSVAQKFGLAAEDLFRPCEAKMTAAEARLELYQILSARGWSPNKIALYFHLDTSTIQSALKPRMRKRAIRTALIAIAEGAAVANLAATVTP